MKLAIVVVYLVAEDDEKLLELHLNLIQKHTSISYTIYAGVNRLLPKFRARLQQRPQVKICSLVPTELRGTAENSFYLEQLVKIAVDDGATHVLTLHPDSFPIRDAWAEKLASPVANGTFATIDRGPYTACLFFARDFYLDHQPHFLPSDTERSSPVYHDFSRQNDIIRHSGVGYLFRAFADGLNWYRLTESSLNTPFGVVYDGLIFHLQGNARLGVAPPDRIQSHPAIVRILINIRVLIRAAIPRRVRRVLWERFGDWLSRVDKPAMAMAKQQLLENPDAYFARIRTHEK